MLTETLVWAMIVTTNHNQVVDVYSAERLCMRDVKAARREVPEEQFKCVPQHSSKRARE